MDIAGHVSRQMLARYSHIRMDAKRKALEAILRKPGSRVDASTSGNQNSNNSVPPGSEQRPLSHRPHVLRFRRAGSQVAGKALR